MIIFIRFKKLKIFLLILLIFIVLFVIGIYVKYNSTKPSSTLIEIKLSEEIQKIFDLRNKALLQKNTDVLSDLYDKDIRNGVWAYDHELKKMKYLHKWSVKQSIKFKKIDSQIIVRSSKKKKDKISLNLLVSTEYHYNYEDTPNTKNSFRIGTYHSLDLIKKDGKLVITREWYTDPFEDSLHLDEIKSEKIKEIISSGKPKNLSKLNDRRIKAVKYADKYCGAASLPKHGYKYNPDYRDYNNEGGDCTNFASQVLHEGGEFSKDYTWNYKKGSGSKAWVNAGTFHNYMLYGGKASLIANGTYDEVLKDSYNLLPGDYIAYEKKGKIAHISIVTGIDSKGYILVNSHNSDRYRVPWDLGWSNRGIKFWLVHVHY